MNKELSDYFSKNGRKGGQKKSNKKTAAARRNAKKGGWPKGKKRKVAASNAGKETGHPRTINN